MSGHPLWTFARALRKGFTSQNSAEIAPSLHDEIDWTVFGPIDMFPYLGARQGKEAALDSIGQITGNFQLHRIKQEDVLIDADKASTLVRCSLNCIASNRPISLRIAAFLRFRDGRVASLRAVIDTFDLVEQVLGRPIHLPAIAQA